MKQDQENPMTSINVSLPASLRDFVQSRVADGFGSVSEYIRTLIRGDKKTAAQERLEKLLIEGLESGDPMPATEELFEKKRRQIAERARRSEKSST